LDDAELERRLFTPPTFDESTHPVKTTGRLDCSLG
jgi:hypothetical protein